jgi:multidrug efflux pump subunit AcrB
MFVGSLALVTKVPMTIMPDMYNRYSEIMVSLDKGVTPVQKNEIAEAINSKLEDIPDVREGFVLDQIEFMFLLINMTPEEEATLEQKEVNERILAGLLELKEEYPIVDVASVMSAGASYPVQIEISGEDLDGLTSLSAEMVSELREIEGIIGTTTSLGSMIDEEQIVEQFRTVADEKDVDDMEEQEEQNTKSRKSMQCPGKHALRRAVTAIAGNHSDCPPIQRGANLIERRLASRH